MAKSLESLPLKCFEAFPYRLWVWVFQSSRDDLSLRASIHGAGHGAYSLILARETDLIRLGRIGEISSKSVVVLVAGDTETGTRLEFVITVIRVILIWFEKSGNIKETIAAWENTCKTVARKGTDNCKCLQQNKVASVMCWHTVENFR